MIDFQKCKDVSSPKPGEWYATSEDQRLPIQGSDKHRLAIICCPVCTCLGSLVHEIAADGAVSPSVVCTHVVDGVACTFHEYIKLVGWEG